MFTVGKQGGGNSTYAYCVLHPSRFRKKKDEFIEKLRPDVTNTKSGY